MIDNKKGPFKALFFYSDNAITTSSIMIIPIMAAIMAI